MSNTKKKHRRPKGGIMGRSDIPLAQRIRMQQQHDIGWSRELGARITMYCWAVAMHQVEGKGYKSLVRFAKRFEEINREFYSQEIEYSMDQARRRLADMGIEISGEIMLAPKEAGRTKRQMEIKHNIVQATQASVICCCIAANDVFGWAKVRLERVREKAEELTARYSKEGEGFLLEYLGKLGFAIVDGHAVGFMDEADNPIRQKVEGI